MSEATFQEERRARLEARIGRIDRRLLSSTSRRERTSLRLLRRDLAALLLTWPDADRERPPP